MTPAEKNIMEYIKEYKEKLNKVHTAPQENKEIKKAV